MKKLIAVCIISSFYSLCLAQSYYFGPKAGPTIGLQQWNNFERDPLLAFHGAFMVETFDEGSDGALYASLGYHIRGSSIRTFNSLSLLSNNNPFKFRNISLQAGVKKKLKKGAKNSPYYLFGVRVEYTLSTNLVAYETANANWPIYPFTELVNKINYGVNIGGGWEFEADKFFIPYFEINIAPDLSLQYEQGPISGVVNPWNGQTYTISERKIRNLSVELSVGMKFLREVKYID